VFIHGFPLVTRGCYEVSQGGMVLVFLKASFSFSPAFCLASVSSSCSGLFCTG